MYLERNLKNNIGGPVSLWFPHIRKCASMLSNVQMSSHGVQQVKTSSVFTFTRVELLFSGHNSRKLKSNMLLNNSARLAIAVYMNLSS